jgi:RNA polymerase sigma-70 factor, ECF subfamily
MLSGLCLEVVRQLRRRNALETALRSHGRSGSGRALTVFSIVQLTAASAVDCGLGRFRLVRHECASVLSDVCIVDLGMRPPINRGALTTRSELSGENHPVMSTEEPSAASYSLMESQGAAAAAVEPAVETSSDSLTFDDFYRREYGHVLGLAFVLTGNQWVAEDTAQDAFTAAFRRWRSIVAYDSPAAWVRRVTCNRAASVLRRRVREAKALMRLAGRAQTCIELDEGDEAFWQAVRRLPPRQAQAVALYYMEGYSVREIAEVLDCSEGTVKTHLSRARDAVARQLQLEDPQ